MKSLVSLGLAAGLTAALSTAAFAQCASKNISAEVKPITPIVTADTTVTTDNKG